MSTEIARRRTGYARIAGTEYPIYDIVMRCAPRVYEYSIGLCNGIPSVTRYYRTRREALAAFNATILVDEDALR